MKYNKVAAERTIPSYKDSLYHWGFIGSNEEGYLAFDSDGLPYISAGSGGGSSVTPSTLVVSETTYGQSSVVGTSLLYARQDHSHGTPALPTLGALGAEAAGTASGLMSTHTGSSDPHTQYQKESEKGISSGYASLDSSTKVPIAQLPTGTSSSTIALGDLPASLITTHEAAGDPHPDYALESNLGTAAFLDVGTTSGDVMAGDPGIESLKLADTTADTFVYVSAADTWDNLDNFVISPGFNYTGFYNETLGVYPSAPVHGYTGGWWAVNSIQGTVRPIGFDQASLGTQGSGTASYTDKGVGTSWVAGASAGNAAGFRTTTNLFAGAVNPIMFFHFTTSADLSLTRHWIGVFTGALPPNSSTWTGEHVMLYQDTTNNWFVSSGNGSNQDTFDTGIAGTTNQTLYCAFSWKTSGTEVDIYIGTTPTNMTLRTTMNTYLPPASTGLRPNITAVRTAGGVAVSLITYTLSGCWYGA